VKPLIILILVFALALMGIRITTAAFDYAFAGRIAMSVMLLFTALGHFKFREGMIRMLPDAFPAKRFTILGTGFIEIAAAIGLQIVSARVLTGWLLILFFILILPANIHAAMCRLNYETGRQDGPGPRYLCFRVPMQIFLIAWVYVFAVLEIA
jgi:uncharacterized membrane protein